MNVKQIEAAVRQCIPPCFGLRVVETDSAVVAIVNGPLAFAGEKLCDQLGAFVIDADETQAVVLLDDNRELRLLSATP